MNELCLSILEFILRSFFCYKNKEMIYLSFVSFPLYSFAFSLSIKVILDAKLLEKEVVGQDLKDWKAIDY